VGTKNAKEYREKLTSMFMDLLKDSLDHPVNWRQGWGTALTQVPYNAARGTRYRGINRFYLSMVACREGFDDPRWATMYQIRKNNWRLQKGSKGYEVEFWFPYDTQAHRSMPWDEYNLKVLSGEPTEDIMIRPRYFYVFNASRIDRIPKIEVKERPSVDPDELISKLSENMGVPILHFNNSICGYRPDKDSIVTPPPELFLSSYEYNSSVLHELAHSTGHASRLNRPLSTQFGSPAYAREELVAEITSAFMGAHLHMPEGELPDTEQHREYVRSWLQQLKNDPNMLTDAIRDAEMANEYMEYHAGIIDKESLVRGMASTREAEVVIQGPEEELISPSVRENEPQKHSSAVMT